MALPPPFAVPYLTPDGRVSDPWQRWQLALTTQVDTALAPIDAQYLVATAAGPLTAERNLGALATGYLRITTALGIATPSTTPTIPAADIAAGTAGISITGSAATTTGNAGSATVLQTARTINGVSFNGSANVTVPAAAGTLTGAALPALDGSLLTGLLLAQIAGLGFGVYTPTLTNVANLDASTAFQLFYVRLGDGVLVGGKVEVNPTTTATATRLDLSLPIPSALVTDEDLSGVAFAANIAGQGAAIHANITGDLASMRWIAGDTSNQAMTILFLYRIL